MTKKSFTENKIFPVLVAVLAIAVALVPCFTSGLFEGHDMSYHVARVESIYDGIVNCGNLKSYIYSKMFQGYGYASGIFYPDIFLYPAVFCRLAGISLVTSMKVLIALYFAAAAYTSYKAGAYIANDTRVGTLVMVLYTLGNYHLLDIYIRSAVGEFGAMIFVPLVFMGLYDLTECGYKKKGVLFLAFTGLMLCHTLSLALCGIAAVIWCIVRIKRVLKRESILGVIVEAVCCVAVTAFYWAPMLEQLANDTFQFSEDAVFYLTDDLMTIPRIYGGVFSISFMELAIMVLVVAFMYQKKTVSKKSVAACICAIALLVIETGIFPWGLIEKTPFASLQFPWRLNMFTEFFAAISIACGLKALGFSRVIMTDTKKYKLSLLLCAALGVFQILSMTFSYMPAEYITYKSYENVLESSVASTVSNEWLPVNITDAATSNVTNEGYTYIDSTALAGVYNDDGTYTFVTNGATGTASVPKVYYKGYAAYATFEDGSAVSLDVFEGEDGLVTLEIVNGVTQVNVYYAGTAVQRYSVYVSVFSLVVLVGIAFVYARKRKTNE